MPCIYNGLVPIHLVYCQLGEWQHAESMNVLRDVLPYSTSDAGVGQVLGFEKKSEDKLSRSEVLGLLDTSKTSGGILGSHL